MGRFITDEYNTVNETTDSLFIQKELKGTNATGNGVVVLKSFSADAVSLNGGFSATNLNVQGAATISADLNVSGILNLTNNARLTANNSNIILTGTTSAVNGSTTSYIVTNGTGSLSIGNIGTGGRTGSVLFPIGTSQNYNPVTMSNTGAMDVFSARVQPGIGTAYTGETMTGTAYGIGAVNASWFLKEQNAGGSNATITLQWNGSEELTGFDKTKSSFGHYTGGAWQLGAPGAATGSDPYSWSGTGITNFSPFGILNSYAVLPIFEVIHRVKRISNSNNCSWQIKGDEGDNVVLEKSLNGRDFTTLFNSVYNTTGTFEDKESTAGKVFYRLKVNGKSGIVKYSNIVWINVNDSQQVNVYPTAFSQTFYIQNNSTQKATLRLYSKSSKLVLQQQLQTGTNIINTKALAAEGYVYHIIQQQGAVSTGHLVKY